MRRGWLIVLTALASPLSANASTFFPVKKVCPVGGEKFDAVQWGSYSTWGMLPDGMPMGSAMFPIELQQCPGNGLVIYRDFTPADIARLKALVADPAYQAMRKTETRYYLAYWLATRLDDTTDAPWLLLNATWQAKNDDVAGARAQRYNDEFIALVSKMSSSDTDMSVIALRARAANALRERGRFDEAEALRGSIVVADTAGGADGDAAANREGWRAYLTKLGVVIARHDPSRDPIDFANKRYAVFRCLAAERATTDGPKPAPLTAFETTYCATPDMVAEIDTWRKQQNR